MSKAAREPFLHRWGRRVLTIPAFFLGGTLYLALLPLTLAFTAVLDLLRPFAGTFSRSRAVLMFALYVVCELVGIAVALAIGVAMLGGRLGGEARYVAANAALQRFWTDALFFGSLRIFGMRVAIEGDALAPSGPLLFFVRHTSVADTVLIAALIANPARRLLLYVLKRELLWDPCLDLVGLRLPNVFVARDGKRGEAEIRAVAGLAALLTPSRAVLLYPEGTRFSEAKRLRAAASLRERGHAELASQADRMRHVLPPKLGGSLALLDAAPDVDVVFVAHTGFEGAASLASFWGGALVGKTIRVRLERVRAAAIPSDNRDAWLFQRWLELDAWVASQLALATGSGGAGAAKGPVR